MPFLWEALQLSLLCLGHLTENCSFGLCLLQDMTALSGLINTFVLKQLYFGDSTGWLELLCKQTGVHGYPL